jgi:hypothetical protein
MKYFADAGIPTLHAALSDHMNSDDLKKLGALTKEKLPTRKADLAAVIMRHLAGAGLQKVWQSLDELQRAAVAEVVHSEENHFPGYRFRAKYGGDPIWESVGGITAGTGYRNSPSLRNNRNRDGPTPSVVSITWTRSIPVAPVFSS